MIKTLQGVIDLAKISEGKKIVVAVAQDEAVLTAVHEAHELGLADASLVGDKNKICDLSEQLNIDISGYEVINEVDNAKAIRTSVDMVSCGAADILMKGKIQTAELLRVVLDKETGLRQGNRVLSQLSLFESEHYHKLLFVTDPGINIAPNLKQKADIIQNAADVAVILGIENPKAAALAALELVNPDMPSTVDAAALSKMADRGQIKNCIVDGPLALDNAVSVVAASHKGIRSNVSGDVDILMVPNIEAGNVLHKALIFLSGTKSCGIVVGARIPIVCVSRAESALSKLYAISLASVIGTWNKINSI